LGADGLPSDAVAVTRSTSLTQNRYNEKAQLTGATGTTDTVAETDIFLDSKNSTQTNKQLSFSHSTNAFAVFYGAAVLLHSGVETKSYSGYTSLDANGVPTDAASFTVSNGETYNFTDQRGRLKGAAGWTTSTSTNLVKDKDREVAQITTSSAINLYTVLFGQPQVARSISTSHSLFGASETQSQSVTDYVYDKNTGQLIGAHGTTTSDNTTTAADRSGSIEKVNADGSRTLVINRVDPQGGVYLIIDEINPTGRSMVFRLTRWPVGLISSIIK
jgi:hypothetical protein